MEQADVLVFASPIYFHHISAQLKKIIEQCDAGSNIKVLGRIPHDQLQPFFDTHNVGLSYIPMTPYYDVQPPTKTFEYLLSGLAVIGTATSENKLVINKNNGVLASDSIENFQIGLGCLQQNLKNFNSKQIRLEAQKYSWKHITNQFNNYLTVLK